MWYKSIHKRRDSSYYSMQNNYVATVCESKDVYLYDNIILYYYIDNNNNNNNVTYIALIRKRSRKCAATCQRQTEMFSVSFWRWSAICWLTANWVASDSRWRDQEQWNCGLHNLSTSVEWWAGECWQIVGDSEQRQMLSTYSTLWGMAARDRWDTCTQWLLSWIQSAAERVASVDCAEGVVLRGSSYKTSSGILYHLSLNNY